MPGAFAEQLTLTPAVGEVTYRSGRILDSRREPIRNAQVEIWQVDHNGAVLHSRGGNADKSDPSFSRADATHFGRGSSSEPDRSQGDVGQFGQCKNQGLPLR